MHSSKNNNNKSKLPTVSIIIPTLLGDNLLIKCIQSIKKLNYPKNKITLTIVDNNSKNNFSKEFKKTFPGMKIIKNKSNLGFANAVNQAIKKSPRDYFFITNDDITMQQNSLLKLINFAEARDKVGICGGKQLYAKNHKFLASGRNLNMFTGRQTDLKNEHKPTSANHIDGCTMLIKKTVIKSVGLFDDEFYPAYFEDIDLCFRAKKKGFLIYYIPQAIFYHHHAYTTSTFPLKEVYYMVFKNRLRFFIKHANIFQLTSSTIYHYLLIMPFRIIFRSEPILIPEINAIIWNIKNFKKTLSARV